jgi:hypothetical protein
MKRAFILTAVCLSAYLAEAQNYAPIKNILAINQYAKAKEELDKNMTNAKFTSKAEAYILKTTIYAGLAMADDNKGKPAGDQLTADADAAFAKYKEMEPELTLMTDLIYQNGPLNLRSSYYLGGYDDYIAKKWAPSFEKLKKAVAYSDLLISKKVLVMPMDTSLLLLAGITAQQSGKREEAAMYYTRLADAKITGEGYEDLYRFLVSYSFEKKNLVAFEKYKALGKELFPKSEYFNYDKVDFAVGLAEGFGNKVAAIEEVLATDPNNYKANEILGELIYDTLNPRDEKAVIPPNPAELEKKMLEAFGKAAAAKPGSEVAYLYMGDHFINKAVKANDEREAFVKAMQARTKPGTKASPEDIKKRDELDKKYGAALEGAKEPYEKAAELFAAKTTLTIRDKQQYKKAVSYLADVFAFKKVQAKANPADQAKYAAEEKKWNDRYDSIK